MTGAKLGFSLSHTFQPREYGGNPVKTRFGNLSRSSRQPQIGRSGFTSVAHPTLLLYGAQSVYNGRCDLTCLCTVCAQGLRWFDG